MAKILGAATGTVLAEAAEADATTEEVDQLRPDHRVGRYARHNQSYRVYDY